MNILRGAFVLVALHASSLSSSAIVPKDTTSPNQFWFSSDIYYVDEDATNAFIQVEFAPGNRSWTGSVDYKVSDGTATGGEDYNAVTGTLNFSGPSVPPPQIIIPILRDKRREGNETVQLFLSNSNAIITRSTATLVIVEKPPALKITPGENRTIVLSWAAEDSDYVLEKSPQLFGTNWTGVASVRSISNGACCVTEPAATKSFYRLRKTSAP